MDANLYALEREVELRLAAAREDAARAALVRRCRGGHRGPLARIGHALVRIARRLGRGERPVRRRARSPLHGLP